MNWIFSLILTAAYIPYRRRQQWQNAQALEIMTNPLGYINTLPKPIFYSLPMLITLLSNIQQCTDRRASSRVSSVETLSRPSISATFQLRSESSLLRLMYTRGRAEPSGFSCSSVAPRPSRIASQCSGAGACRLRWLSNQEKRGWAEERTVQQGTLVRFSPCHKKRKGHVFLEQLGDGFETLGEAL